MVLVELLDLLSLQPILKRYASDRRRKLLPTLFEAQRVNGYLPESAIGAIRKGLHILLVDIHGVIEF